jgi:hypothetical protein
MREDVANQNTLLSRLRKFGPIVCHGGIKIDLPTIDEDMDAK